MGAKMVVRRTFSMAKVVVLASLTVAGAVAFYVWWDQSRRASWPAQCRLAQSRGNLEEVRRVARLWTRNDPQSAEAWLFLAEAANGLDDPAGAAAAYRQIPENHAQILPVLRKLAPLEFEPLNHPREGEEVCLHMLRLDPHDKFAHQCLIQYYATTVQRAKLLKSIRFAIDQESEPPEAFVFLFLLDSLRIGNGVQFNDHWLEVRSDDELFLVARALSLPEPGDKVAVKPVTESGKPRYETPEQMTNEKESMIESLYRKYPNNLELLAYQLDKNAKRGEIDLVADLLSRAPQSGATDSRFWYHKGWYFEALEDTAEAEVAFRKALEINPLDWNARNRLAACSRKRNDRAEVERLNAICDQARDLQKQLVELHSAEFVTPEMLTALADYARRCEVAWLTAAIERALGRGEAVKKSNPREF
jgi:tetratricopeptide (TPR) repeat protein